MSETDSFIQEVSEEVRKDRMFRLWKKYGPYAVTGVVAVVAVTAGLNWMKLREIQQARETGGAFLASDIASVEDQEVLTGSVDGPAAVIARLRLAAATAGAGDVKAAAALYREVADEAGLDPVYADLARLQAVRVSVAAMDPAQAVAELEPLIAEGAPYRVLALELRAMVRLNSGDTEAAHADLAAIIGDPQATRESSQRALALLMSSGGELPPGVQ
ncbi:MAG: tetratricopeptide repeat protein [Alphaproteobacteria bacterium]